MSSTCLITCGEVSDYAMAEVLDAQFDEGNLVLKAFLNSLFIIPQ